MRIDVLGVAFDSLTMEQAVLRAHEVLDGGGKAYIVTPNPEIVWMCRRDDRLRHVINGAELVLPDGIGIILGAKILKTPLLSKIAGIDFAGALFAEMAGNSVYLLGAKPGVAEEAGRRLSAKYPGLVIAGVSDGYFTDDGPVIETINAASPDVLLVCMGAPRQELWISENLGRLNAKLCMGLGGSLDVYAGVVKRAPTFLQKLGLEWFYRLLREPRRIKRMLKLPLFVLAVVWKRMRGKILTPH